MNISVVIPVCNGARFLAEAIESVLSQNLHPLEVILVDDGSSDATGSIASAYAGRVSYRYQARQGPSAARNRGAAEVRGDCLAFLDHDDVWHADNLERLAQSMGPDTDIVLGMIQEQVLDTGSGQWRASRAPTYSPSLPSMLCRRSAWHRLGGLDESIVIGEDKDWFYRAREQGLRIALAQGHLGLYHRRHETNLTNTMLPPEQTLLRLLRRSLQRRDLLS